MSVLGDDRLQEHEYLLTGTRRRLRPRTNGRSRPIKVSSGLPA
jgi:hypothetical protein